MADQKPMQLTKDDCAALRGATTYVVRLEGETASLELIKKLRTKPRVDGFGSTSIELERTIGGAAGSLTRGTFVQLYAHGAFQALARLVRPGDVLKLYADPDGGNQYLRAAVIPAGTLEGHGGGYDRLYLDELCVDVIRGRRLLVDRLVLAYSLTPQNSARAVEASARREWAVA